MTKLLFKWGLSLTLLLLISSQAIASAKKQIDLKSLAEVEVMIKNDEGKEELKRVNAADANVVPGDTVIFSTYYTNVGKEPASDIVINNPMPRNMLYIDGTAEGRRTKIEFSVDNGKVFGRPDKLTIKDAGGKERAASSSDYTNIRWSLTGDLGSGKSSSVSFRAKVK